MLKLTSVLIFMAMIVSTYAQNAVDLYPHGLRNQRSDVPIEDNAPQFFAYLPEGQPSEIAFLIIPGGGYARVAIQHEGHDVAKRLQDLGYAAFVLRYRLPNAAQQYDKRIAPLQDAQSAIAYIRENFAKQGQIKHVGVLGFSAGGHLASTLSTHFEMDSRTGKKAAPALKPDFSVLLYPVISMEDGITHNGSKNNLIGPNPAEGDVLKYSNEKNISRDTPPAFLMHAADDRVVPIANSERYLEALRANGVAGTLFRYETGGHGFGMYNKTDSRDWFEAMLRWVKDHFEK